MSAHDVVRRWWRGESGKIGAAASVLAAPLEALFRAGVAIRGRLYDTQVLDAGLAPIPVVSVGNLTVGGTGKTPIVRWIVGALQSFDARPAVIVRGFADEVALHRRWYPSVPVVEDASRLRGAQTAAAAGATVAVLDDGFQHRQLARDLDIVVVATSDRLGPVRLLPRGPYRERPKALVRADIVLISDKRPIDAPEARAAIARARDWVGRWAPDVPVHSVRLAAAGWQHLDGSPAAAPQGDVLAVAGIGAPETFLATVRSALGGTAELMTFPDHHRYDHADLQSILETARGRSVVLTEKDAVKLARFPGFHATATTLLLDVHEVEREAELRDRLADVVRGSEVRPS